MPRLARPSNRRCRGLVTVGLIGRLLGVPELPDPSPRFPRIPPTRHRLATMRGSRGDWTRLQSHGHCADPRLSRASQLAVTAVRSAEDPNRERVVTPMSSTTDHAAGNRCPRGSPSGRYESCRCLVSPIMHCQGDVVGPRRVCLRLRGPSLTRHEGALQPASKEADASMRRVGVSTFRSPGRVRH